MLDVSRIKELALNCQKNLMGLPTDINSVHDLGELITDLDVQIRNVSNLDLFKILKKDKEINTCISITMSMGTTLLLSLSFEGNKEAIRNPLRSLINRINNFMEDEAIKRLRVLE